jgi:hypothetical protein
MTTPNGKTPHSRKKQPPARQRPVAAVPQDALFFTVEEWAAVHRVGLSSAWNYVHEGLVPSIKIGRMIRVPRSAMFHEEPAAVNKD